MSLPLSCRFGFAVGYGQNTTDGPNDHRLVFIRHSPLGLGCTQVAMHKGSLGLRADNPRGLSGQLIAYYSAENNPNNLPGYVMVNGNVNAALGHGKLTLAAVNILDKAGFDYGQQFTGVPQAQQPGNPVVPTKLFGLPPTACS